MSIATQYHMHNYMCVYVCVAIQSKHAPVPIRNFGKHVEVLHTNNNEQFITEYEVSCIL